MIKDLTPQERAVAKLLSEDGSYKIIADKLGISMHTVKFHLRNIMKKLKVRTGVEIAVAYVLENTKTEHTCPNCSARLMVLA